MAFTDDFKQVTRINESTVIIQPYKSEPIRLDERLRLLFLSFDVADAEPITITTTQDFVDGAVDHGTSYAPRQMTLRLMLQAIDVYDYALRKREIKQIFDSKRPFSLIDEDNPRMIWQQVKRSGGMTFDRKSGTTAIITVPLISYSAYARSVGTTTDPITFDSGLWQFGQLPLDDFKYSHNTRSFSIYNLGDKDIDPGIERLNIYYKGASSNLAIQNRTTGQQWTYAGTTTATDTLSLVGVEGAYKNSTSILKQTNRRPITLESGINEIVLTGTSGAFEIEFDFYYYFLE